MAGMNRRGFLFVTAAAAAVAQGRTLRQGRLKQCVTTGVFRNTGMSLDDMARHAAELGAYGFDLIGPKDWPILKKYGLVPTMMPPPYGGTIPVRITEKDTH